VNHPDPIHSSEATIVDEKNTYHFMTEHSSTVKIKPEIVLNVDSNYDIIL